MKDKILQRISYFMILISALAALFCIERDLRQRFSQDSSAYDTAVYAETPIETKPITSVAVSTTTVHEEEPEPTTETIRRSSEFIGADPSPNSELYLENLAIAGDSIASGFYHYGLIPSEHNIAQSSVSIWNLDYFTYNFGTGELDTIEAVGYVQPALLYLSIGMNDVNFYTAEEYKIHYRATVESLLEVSPDTIIIAAAITPIYETNDFIDNSVIREFNIALEEIVTEMDDPMVYFFDAYTVVADKTTLALRDGNSSGDGMHLAEHCYQDLLDCLFSYLDSTPVREKILDLSN